MDDLLGPEGWIYHERSAWVWMRGVFVPYPFQLNLRHLPPAEKWEAVRGLLKLNSNGTAEPANLGEWVERTFGEGISKLFLRPYNFKVWAYPLEELSWKWIGDRVAVVDVERAIQNILLERDDVSWGPNNKFRFPVRGGTGEVWRRLGERLRGSGFVSDSVSSGWTLGTGSRTFESGLAVRYRAPAEHVASGRARERERPLRASSARLRPRLRYSSTHIIGVGLHGSLPESLDGKCWMYFPESDCPFYRVTVFSHYSPNNVPDIRRLLVAHGRSVGVTREARRLGEASSRTRFRDLVATGLIESREPGPSHLAPTASSAAIRHRRLVATALSRSCSRLSRSGTSSAEAGSAPGSTRSRIRTIRSHRGSRSSTAGSTEPRRRRFTIRKS